jgi:hypothetical protein
MVIEQSAPQVLVVSVQDWTHTSELFLEFVRHPSFFTKDSANGRNHSSPRSVATPLGPNRLTLPADHQAPMLGQRSSDATVADPKDSPAGRRPVSSRLRYALDESARTMLTVTTDVHLHRQYQYVPSHPQQGQPDASEPQQGTPYQQQMRTMMPPPPVTREKAGGVPSRARGQPPPGDVGNQTQRPLPPSTPFGSADVHHVGPQTMASGRFTPRVSTSQGTNSRFIPQTPVPRRFVPAAPTAGGPRIHSRAGNPDPVLHGGQRTPFFSGARMG